MVIQFCMEQLGSLYASGQAGERFAARNSGSLAVIEGCGAQEAVEKTGNSDYTIFCRR